MCRWSVLDWTAKVGKMVVRGVGGIGILVKRVYFCSIQGYIMGMTDQHILLQLKQMPDDLKQEVLDFIGYLLMKHNLTQEGKHKPTFGSAKGKYSMKADFDEPLEV